MVILPLLSPFGDILYMHLFQGRSTEKHANLANLNHYAGNRASRAARCVLCRIAHAEGHYGLPAIVLLQLGKSLGISRRLPELQLAITALHGLTQGMHGEVVRRSPQVHPLPKASRFYPFLRVLRITDGDHSKCARCGDVSLACRLQPELVRLLNAE